MPLLSSLTQEARIAARSLADYVGGTGLRLGVTGLSRAGKTVFITALVEALLNAGRSTAPGRRNPLPVFRVHAEGRLTRSKLEPQPDDAVPRFAYEDHLAALTGGSDGPEARHWPESTRRISELRLTLEFERKSGWRSGSSSLTLDIVDYPGEWLLDLPLLSKSYPQWSGETLEASAAAARAPLAADWRGYLKTIDPAEPASEDTARKAAELFTAYLRASRADKYALSTLPPGRFLMPGDLEGSPALTFAPLPTEGGAPSGSLAAMMERRYEAYKTHVVRPFFRDHFARLDRQIVLVDALSALNSGPAAVRDLETAMTDVLMAFRAGRASFLTTLFRPRVDRILFAATKADHLHHTSHDRLEAILRHLTSRAISRAEGVGAEVDVIALAAVRATREASVRQGRETLDAIVGTPLKGETVGGDIFDGTQEVAIFPGSLPADPRTVFRGDALAIPEGEADYRFVRFRPPVPQPEPSGGFQPLPHIRLDRALEFLFGESDGMTDRPSERTLRPRAFRLEDADLGALSQERDRVIVESQPDVFAQPDDEPRDQEEIVETAQRKGIVSRSLFTWGGLFWSAALGLVTLSMGVWFDGLISNLFARTPALGWIGVALIGALVLALLVLAGREVAGVLRQKRIGQMHIALAKAREADDTAAARSLVRDLTNLYASRAETARARAHVLDLTREIVDGRDLIDITERTLILPLDDTVQHEIAKAAKRVSVVTAISPRAIVDLLFVAAQAFRLVRRISEIYGGRPGMVGFLRLLRSVGAHLAITGGMAAGDSLVQQVLGHGIAAKLSARLGEGVLNGMLTARVGLSAMAVCRPMPFAAEPAPGVKDVAPFLFRSGEP